MYFTPFPLTTYTLGNKTEDVVDIFRRVAVSNINNNQYLNEIIVTDSDTLESLAEKYYNDPKLSCVIAIINNMINPNEEFIKSTQVLTYLYSNLYKGTIFYIEEYVNIQEGDIIIGVNSGVSTNTIPANLTAGNLITGKYCFVSSYDKQFRYARVINVNGIFSAGDKIAIFRKINNALELVDFYKKTNATTTINGCVIAIKKIDTYLNSPVMITNSSDNSILSPYQSSLGPALENKFISEIANGMYSAINDTNSFYKSIGYRVLMNNESINNVTYLKLVDDIKQQNEKYRKIKLIPKELLPAFLDKFTTMISSSDTRSRLINSRD